MSKPLLSRTRRAGNILYLSGIIGRGDDEETRFRNTFERIKEVLEENGLTLKDMVKATVYLEDIEYRPKLLNPSRGSSSPTTHLHEHVLKWG